MHDPTFTAMHCNISTDFFVNVFVFSILVSFKDFIKTNLLLWDSWPESKSAGPSSGQVVLF
jgi:hypothetical protein